MLLNKQNHAIMNGDIVHVNGKAFVLHHADSKSGYLSIMSIDDRKLYRTVYPKGGAASCLVEMSDTLPTEGLYSLYTAPAPQREWQGLTENDWDAIQNDKILIGDSSVVWAICLTETLLRAKNEVSHE